MRAHAEHEGFVKAAMPQMATKLLNKGRQVMQGSARTKALGTAKGLRSVKQRTRTLGKQFKGLAEVSSDPRYAKAHGKAKAALGPAAKSNTRSAIAGAGATVVGGGIGYAVSPSSSQ